MPSTTKSQPWLTWNKHDYSKLQCLFLRHLRTDHTVQTIASFEYSNTAISVSFFENRWGSRPKFKQSKESIRYSRSSFLNFQKVAPNLFITRVISSPRNPWTSRIISLPVLPGTVRVLERKDNSTAARCSLPRVARISNLRYVRLSERSMLRVLLVHFHLARGEGSSTEKIT